MGMLPMASFAVRSPEGQMEFYATLPPGARELFKSRLRECGATGLLGGTNEVLVPLAAAVAVEDAVIGLNVVRRDDSKRRAKFNGL